MLSILIRARSMSAWLSGCVLYVRSYRSVFRADNLLRRHDSRRSINCLEFDPIAAYAGHFDLEVLRVHNCLPGLCRRANALACTKNRHLPPSLLSNNENLKVLLKTRPTDHSRLGEKNSTVYICQIKCQRQNPRAIPITSPQTRILARSRSRLDLPVCPVTQIHDPLIDLSAGARPPSPHHSRKGNSGVIHDAVVLLRPA